MSMAWVSPRYIFPLWWTLPDRSCISPSSFVPTKEFNEEPKSTFVQNDQWQWSNDKTNSQSAATPTYSLSPEERQGYEHMKRKLAKEILTI